MSKVPASVAPWSAALALLGLALATPLRAAVTERPLLVIMADFSDQADENDSVYEGRLPPAEVRKIVFGSAAPGEEGFPHVNGFYWESSYGQFRFTDGGAWFWLPGVDDPATPDADESTRDWYDNVASDDEKWRHWMKTLDDHGWDFAQYDTGGGLNGEPDGLIDLQSELSVVIWEEYDPGVDANGELLPKFSGVTRGTAAGFVLDGKTFTGTALRTGVPARAGPAGGGYVGMKSSRGNQFAVMAHELGHAVFGWTDYYSRADDIDGYSLMGHGVDTGGHVLDPYSKLTQGWLEPREPRRDGWMSLRDSETSGEDILKLVNPDSGGAEYFLIENRWPGESYDGPSKHFENPPGSGAANQPTPLPDSGIVAWHVDERLDWPDSTGDPPQRVHLLQRVVGDYSKTAYAAEDGVVGLYEGTPQDGLRWHDGTPSGFGLYCFGDPGPEMRVYVDVPGDAGGAVFAVCQSEMAVSARPGEHLALAIDLVNTSVSVDSYELQVLDADPDVTVSWDAAEWSGIPPRDPRQPSLTITVAPDCQLVPLETRELTVRIASVNFSRLVHDIPVTITLLGFVDPEVEVAPASQDAWPGEMVRVSGESSNAGNGPGRQRIYWRGLSLEDARAEPQAIPASWLLWTFLDVTPLPCLQDVVDYENTVSVPSDWAGMEPTPYPLALVATSPYGPDLDDEAVVEIVVQPTPESQLRYTRLELLRSAETVAQTALATRVESALGKIDHALVKVQLGQLEPAFNNVGAARNVMTSALRQTDVVERQGGLTTEQAADFRRQAAAVVDDVTTIMESLKPLLRDVPGFQGR